MKLKVCVLGPKQSGKTSLSRLLTPRDIDLFDEKNPSIPILRTFRSDDKRTQLDVFDFPSESVYPTVRDIFARNTDVFIYCVDLSQELDKDKITCIKSECQQLSALSPNAQIVLVGTKSDIALAHLQESTKTLKPFSLVPMSISEPLNKDYRQELLSHFVPIQRIKQARNRFSEGSGMYSKLNQLVVEMRQLPRSIQMALAQEVEQLVTQVLNPLETDKATPLQAFQDHCNELVPKENSGLVELLLSIAISIVVTILAGLVGFGIGFGLGAWSGPGAFFTGLAIGTASAIAVATAAPSVGIATMGYCAYRFLKPTPLQMSLNEVYEQAQQVSRN